MGMSNWIVDLEEQFDSKVEEAVKQSECVEEAVAEAMKHRDLVTHMTDEEVEMKNLTHQRTAQTWA